MPSSADPSWTVVDDGVLRETLSVYKPDCRYLHAAWIDHAGLSAPHGTGPHARARFVIPASYYIEDTGHLNSVELNIAYNQLAYVLIAHCIVHDLLPELRHLTLEDFRARQLPDILIHRITSTFKRSIDRGAFEGDLRVEAALNTERFVRVDTRSRFWDEGGGLARSEVALVIMNDRDAPPPGDGASRPRSR